MPINSERIEFPGASGALLAARLDRPVTTPIAFALFAHCFTCTKDSKAATYVSQALAEQGFAVLRFDFTGLGGSDGDFANTNFSSNVADLVAAARFLGAHHRAPQLLVGHSLGGTAVLSAAASLPEVRALGTIGSPFEPGHVAHLLRVDWTKIEADGSAEVNIGGRPFMLKKQFLDDLATHSEGPALERLLGRLGKALLVMHSPRDTIVSVDNASRIFGAAKHPKSFVSLDPADHLLSRREDAVYAGQVLAAWAARHIVADCQVVPPLAVDGRVVVRETREGKFTNDIVIGPHHLRADEPVAVGGLATGPSPYDFLGAALGTCTAMTLRLYADLKKIPLERISVEVKHDKIHATDCAECETREGKVDQFERVIALEGQINAGDRAQLLEIADKCPVHRTLHSEVRVVTHLAVAE